MTRELRDKKDFVNGWEEDCRGREYLRSRSPFSGIRPTLICLKLSMSKCSQLVVCLKSVLLKL